MYQLSSISVSSFRASSSIRCLACGSTVRAVSHLSLVTVLWWLGQAKSYSTFFSRILNFIKINLLKVYFPCVSCRFACNRSCPDFPRRIVLLGALLSWRHFPKGHTPCSRSFNFQGSVSPDKTHFTEKTGPLPYVQNDGKRLKISIFPRLWNHGIIVKNGRIFLMRGGV